MQIETLTQIQESAIDYLMSRSRPNDHRCHRKAMLMVRNWCTVRGWSDEDARQCARDMWDMYQLEKAALSA